MERVVRSSKGRKANKEQVVALAEKIGFSIETIGNQVCILNGEKIKQYSSYIKAYQYLYRIYNNNKNLSPEELKTVKDNYKPILTKDKVKKIKILISQGDMTLTQIGNMFNVSSTQISKIKSGKSWSNVKN